MASIDRYRPREGYQPPPAREGYQPPTREGYQPPTLPPPRNTAPGRVDRPSKSPSKRSPTKRREIPPAAPSPPTHTSRNSPPRPHSRRSAPSPLEARSPSHTAVSAERPGRSQWFFTPEELRATPSIIEGLSPAEERLRRAKGVNFIYQAGVLLELPQITLWVAAVFFHRFYMRMNMLEEKGGIHHYNIAATALFLANKTEENCKRTKDLIIAVAKVAQKNAKLIIDEQSKEYWRWRDNILMYEEMMLEQLTFDLMVDNPYKRLHECLKQLGIAHNRRLRDAAWAFCNDACLTPLPLLMDARDVAVAAIFFATVVARERIEDGAGAEPWWKALGGDEGRCVAAIDLMLEFYAENPLRKQESRVQGSPEFSLEGTRRRGDTVLSQTEAGSSQAGSPPSGTDRGGTLSPRAKLNGGRADREGESSDKTHSRKESDDGALGEADARPVPGDSDEALKAAANDLDVHVRKPNGNGMLAAAKRKSQERDDDNVDEARRDKRQRQTSEDT